MIRLVHLKHLIAHVFLPRLLLPFFSSKTDVTVNYLLFYNYNIIDNYCKRVIYEFIRRFLFVHEILLLYTFLCNHLFPFFMYSFTYVQIKARNCHISVFLWRHKEQRNFIMKLYNYLVRICDLKLRKFLRLKHYCQLTFML